MLLSLYVFGWDYGIAGHWTGETLSDAFRRATHDPVSRWPVVVAWTVTTAHLYGWIPEKFDPFHLAANAVTAKRRLAANVLAAL